MFLHELGSSDPRFRTLTFHDGMNVLLADRTSESTTGDSRNGAGKSSFVKILRYLLGGSLDKSLQNSELRGHVFSATLAIASGRDLWAVERPTSPGSRVFVNSVQQPVETWKALLSKEFGLSPEVKRPTVAQLTGQLVRTYFQDAVKTHSHDTDLDCGIRIGHLLGFSPEVLGKAIEVFDLERQRKALRGVIKAGVLPSLSLSASGLRAQLAQTRNRYQNMKDRLSGFRVDEQYADHQRQADHLSAELRKLNTSALALRRRQQETRDATAAEQPSLFTSEGSESRLQAMYEEVGLALPEAVIRRFDEVAEFHSSVVRNRRLFLQAELESVEEQLTEVENRMHSLDAERAGIMDLLEQSMALETFRAAEAELTRLEATITDLEHRIEQAEEMESADLRLKTMGLQAQTTLRTEFSERTRVLEDAMSLFSRLGEEVYSDRNVSLLVEPTSRGVLKIDPKIDGDASTGIAEVKTFLLDIVCLISAIHCSRAPRFLVHDSLLFDSIDDRQVASCLNIGARLADEHGFQYIVTMNSDRLEAVEREGFERRDYVIDTVLTDKGEEGGLFGFRFQ